MDRGQPSFSERAAFRAIVLQNHRLHGRDHLPWRRTRDPYAILVSEFMLQQTQVVRVLDKYRAFLAAFPGFDALAQASLAQVLTVWQGLGYPRRARNLHALSQIVRAEFGGRLPDTYEELLSLPGVGPATAGAVAAFAYGLAHPFLETNIRAALLHHFHPCESDVSEARLMALLEATLDREQPRRWFYALMDYGHLLKRAGADSGHRARMRPSQAPYAGSWRQLRGRVLRYLVEHQGATARSEEGRSSPPAVQAEHVAAALGLEQERVEAALRELAGEHFVVGGAGGWSIA